MGEAIAERILDAGYPLAVYNRTRSRTEPLAARGAAVLDSAGDALARADVCVTMLADDAAFEAVASEVLAGARPGTTLIDMSTVSPAASERVAERTAEAYVDFLRSPVSGNPTVVRGGTLTLVVSGPEDVAQRARPAAARDRAEGLLRRRGRARPRREARAAGARRRDRGAARRGASCSASRRRRPREAARGDQRLGGRLAAHGLQGRARCCATTTPRRSRRR